MRTYYWKAKPNFGDLLSTLLLKRFTKFEAEWSEPKTSDLIVVGSILEHMPESWNGVIAGAGLLREESRMNFRHARIFALRGPLTAARVTGADDDLFEPVLADPGLLANELIQLPDKEYNLGIIPHWTDKELAHRPEFLKYNPKIINVADNPLKVIEEIAKCKKIISSSLHGIVLADAFNIPRRIEISPTVLAKPKQEGGLFKWEDYSASINMPLIIGKTQEANVNTITQKQHELYDVFEEIKSFFINFPKGKKA